jgi:hypothetical protein
MGNLTDEAAGHLKAFIEAMRKTAETLSDVHAAPDAANAKGFNDKRENG